MDITSFMEWFLSWSNNLVQTFGYLGVFLASFIGSATIFLPTPFLLVVFISGSFLNPWLVGISAAIGCVLGEFTGYGIGFAGQKALDKKHEKWLKKARKWMEKYKMFFVIILFAATPLPDDVLGILCGAIKYDVKKFFIASFIGKLILNLSIAFGGYYGMQWVLNVLGGV